ncbi:MAG TPA: O-antigen translocase [Terriglobales bacterium]|nr:O-antigen translocase [Terriglobales bacterium]
MASTAFNPEIEAPILDIKSDSSSSSSSDKGSYGQILKSSALIGGAEMMNVGVRIVRTKAMAMLLGPAGFGLAGLYSSLSDLSQSIAGMGVNSSGVRQIAEAVGSGDTERIARTVAVVRRISLVLGIFGTVLLVVFSRQVSNLTFGTPIYGKGVALLSVCILFRLISGAQSALIQGMRRIADLAKMNLMGAILGTVLGIPLVYYFRDNGIVPYLIAVGVTAVLTSWWYSRKVDIPRPPLAFAEARHEAAALLKLGFAFMASGLMTIGVAYAVRIILSHKVGLQATGYYQSAWTLGGLYVGFILQAMAADFYPRLTASIHNHGICNRLVNEQARVGLLLAAPGVIATLTFAPAVITVFYSAKFGASVDILRWICLGTTLQVITWPMGFIIVAGGRQNLFIFSEVAWAIASLIMAWTCISYFGVVGAGIAFFGSYIFHGFLIYAIVSRLTQFRWSMDNLKTGLILLPMIAAAFCSSYLLPLFWSAVIGVLLAIISSIHSIRTLLRLTAANESLAPRIARLRYRIAYAARTLGF